MKTILTIATAFILSLTLSVNAQSTTSKKATKNNEINHQRSENEKLKAKTEKETVEKNILTMIAEIKTEEKKLEEIKAQQTNSSTDAKVDEAIKNKENEIMKMTEKLIKENDRLKKLNEIISENN
ncbi:MAG: hypothetical protein K0B10_08490 [Vicingaceae bacterium]|nr:hypothetical protein [Vicingaceae bacterium]